MLGEQRRCISANWEYISRAMLKKLRLARDDTNVGNPDTANVNDDSDFVASADDIPNPADIVVDGCTAVTTDLASITMSCGGQGQFETAFTMPPLTALAPKATG